MQKYAIALGMFDGVHIGHKAVLDGAIKSGHKSVAVTFSSLPFKSGGSIMTAEEKREKLLAYGVDEVKFFEFDEIKDLEPTEFLDFICQKHNVAKICCGFNYRFGKKAAGNTQTLKNYCAENEIEFFECPEVVCDGETVSSTRIKELLLDGKAELAARLLGENFFFESEVIEGDKRGRTWGFPTINQLYPKAKATVKFGVYHTLLTIDGQKYHGVANIGIRPTYENNFVSSETYILDFSDNCYGKTVKCELVEFLRGEKKFSSKEELIDAIKQDAEYVKDHR